MSEQEERVKYLDMWLDRIFFSIIAISYIFLIIMGFYAGVFD